MPQNRILRNNRANRAKNHRTKNPGLSKKNQKNQATRRSNSHLKTKLVPNRNRNPRSKIRGVPKTNRKPRASSPRSNHNDRGMLVKTNQSDHNRTIRKAKASKLGPTTQARPPKHPNQIISLRATLQNRVNPGPKVNNHALTWKYPQICLQKARIPGAWPWTNLIKPAKPQIMVKTPLARIVLPL